MKQTDSRLWVILLVCFLATPFSAKLSAAETAQATDAEKDRFFETHIRPILIEKCQDCHGGKKQWAELRVDSRDFMLKGGESGPAVVPGKPDDSRLVQVIRYSEEDSQMPPDGKLSDEQIARLTEWVAQGAYWPAKPDGEQPTELDYYQQAKTHWAFQPVKRPEIPAVPAGARVANPIDHFIVAKLQEKSLTQSPRAEPQSLLRRLAFDLTGLPVGFEESQKFVNQPSSEQWQEWVDRLLASEDFGHKWARYWLDVARYADTKGYVFTQERRYPFAYTYRDYVIKSLNEDLPYDQFIREQLAADLLPEKRSEEALAALGFLTVGQRFLNRVPDILDDRIDVTTRGFLGLTLACARCHDHKFDPLSAADYYALYGVFDSTYEPGELPQIGPALDPAAFEEYSKELEKRQADLKAYQVETAQKVNQELREHLADYLYSILNDAGNKAGKIDNSTKYSIRNRGKDNLRRYLQARSPEDPVFGLWRRLQNLSDEEFAKEGKAKIEKLLAEQADGKYQGNWLLINRLKQQQPTNMYEVATLYAELFATVTTPIAAPDQPAAENKAGEAASSDEAKTDQQETAAKPGDESTPAPSAEELAAQEQLRATLASDQFAWNFTAETISTIYNQGEGNKSRQLANKMDELMISSPGAPPRAMVLYDKDRPASPVIFKRGNPGMRGDAVPRRFLQVLDFVRSEPFGPQSSGRLELAEAIASRENPLTARVLVNRVWMQLIGQPLVESTDDFGLRTPLATHPELLDFLAYEFMNHGWSIKWLVREIVSSETYQQSSLSHPSGMQHDLENSLVWRMNRKRLPFESMRDAMLQSSGQLDRRMYGRPEQLEGEQGSLRRAVYGFVDRNNISSLLRTFDVASPNAAVTQRVQTTVPQQALFVMNSPFMLKLSETFVKQLDEQQVADPAVKIRLLFRHALQRNPSAEELQLAGQFLQASDSSPEAWRELGQVLLLTNEFLFLD